MGNIQNEIDRITGAKTTLGTYLAGNGVEVTDDEKIDVMANQLANVTEKQNKIMVSGVLQGDGQGNITAKDLREIVNGGYGISSLGDPNKEIVADNDLNTESFMHVGTYFCRSSAAAKTLSNCPAKEAFMMHVYCPTSASDSLSTWAYRVRKITDLKGNEFIQPVNSGATAGVYTWGSWKQSGSSSPQAIAVSLPAASWNSSKQQTVSVAGVTADNTVFVTYSPGSRANWVASDVYCSAQAAGTLTFTYAGDTPTAAITANVAIMG